MNPLDSNPDSSRMTDSAAASAEAAIRSTQRMANQALDGASSGVSHLRAEVAPMIRAATEQVTDLAHRGVDAVRHGSQQLVDGAHEASARTRDYVQHEPVKALLMAAATGAVLMALLSMVQRQRSQL